MNALVDVQYVSYETKLPNRYLLTNWVNTVLQHQEKEEKGEAHQTFCSSSPFRLSASEKIELTIRIVDEDEARKLNKKWRQHPYPTNILSFPLECPFPLEIPLLGDLVICAPIVNQEAAKQHKTLEAHWAHLVVHGILHLLGYDHLDEAQAQIMESLEIQILHDLGFPNPYE